MATTMTDGVAALARQIATDQIAQDIETNAQFSQVNTAIQTNAQNLSDFEQQLIAVCNEVASGATTQQLSSEEN